ncbi:hypothetical protein GGF46_003109 [Coemansia sp. RSA 552]|nr:hypothetical protein GGF46_003109 [Coemansia sp. RSA 552]
MPFGCWRKQRRDEGPDDADIGCCEDKASVLSRLFFAWVTPLIAYGWSQPVQLDRLPSVGTGDELVSAAISARFQSEWAREARRARAEATNQTAPQPGLLKSAILACWAPARALGQRIRKAPVATRRPQPSLIRPLYRLVLGHLVRAFAARLAAELIPVFVPILVQQTTTYVQLKRQSDAAPPAWQGYTLVVSMFAMLLLYSWSFQWFFFEIGKATVVIRSALTSAIYRKSLVLSPDARARLTLGKLTNLVSSDMGQIERGVTSAIVCVTIPIQVMVSIAVLIYMIGPVSIAGWALVIAFVPAQMLVSRYLVQLRRAAATCADQRIRAVREAMQGIKVVKAFAWESAILAKVQQAREKEVAIIARMNLIRYTLISFALHSPVFAAILTFAILALSGGVLKNGPVFAVIGIFNSMSVPLSWLPVSLTETWNTLVPLGRIAEALAEDELEPPPEPQQSLDVAIRVADGVFGWSAPHHADEKSSCEPGPGALAQGDPCSIKETLKNYTFPHEPTADKGTSHTQDGFCLSQINLDIPHGSLVIVIGSVGSGKSSLAAALAGEMSRVSGSIALSSTFSYVPQVPWVMNASVRDNILFGEPYNADAYASVIEACELEADFASLPAGDRTEIGERGTTLSGGQKQRVSIARAVYSGREIAILDDCLSAVDVRTSQAIFRQCRATGQISLSTYIAYGRASGGWVLFVGIVLCLAAAQGCRIGGDFWIRMWLQRQADAHKNMGMYIAIYALFGGLQLVCFALFSVLLVVSVYKGSRHLHARAFERTLRSPMSFFDTTPLGRILNRFTRDVDALDLTMCDFLRQFYQNTSRSIGAFVTISILVPMFLVPLIPLFVGSWALIYVYLRTSVEIQRLASISRSPLYAHYSETLQGLATIRAYNAQERYTLTIHQALDDANRPHWYSLVAQNWVWLRVDYLSHLLTLTICLIIVSQPARWDAAAVGLMLVQATQMGVYVTYAGRGWSELQNNMNAVERINYYASKLDQEPPDDGPSAPVVYSENTSDVTVRPINRKWPTRGTVIVRDLSLRHRPGLPLALDGVNIEVYDGERIGIVGRSGAGKSSLVSALFRLAEPSGGKIFVDGIDTHIVPLARLRAGIGMLPQDPVLFEGTLRSNLDPFDETTDSAIWSALRQVRLYDHIARRPEKLDMPIDESGENFSVGQRQLLCLARVLLRRPRILVLDEATASVDYDTDVAIQQIIASSAWKLSVISIAHRLQTVATYDRIYVMDQGKVVESGAPLTLLERHLLPGDTGLAPGLGPSPAFHRLIAEMSDDARERLLTQARMAVTSRHGTPENI